MVLTLKIGSENTGTLIPVADAVLCKLTNIQPNKYNPDTVIDFGFTIIDFDFEDDDEQTEAEIRRLADNEHIHWERYNLPAAGQDLGKGTKLYKHLKGMKGGRDIEQGEEIDLNEFLAKNYRIDFEHEDKKGPPPDFAVVRDDKGNPVQKVKLAKIRPEKRSRRRDEETVVSAPARKEAAQAALPANDDDLYPGDDDDE